MAASWWGSRINQKNKIAFLKVAFNVSPFLALLERVEIVVGPFLPPFLSETASVLMSTV